MIVLCKKVLGGGLTLSLSKQKDTYPLKNSLKYEDDNKRSIGIDQNCLN